jgi:quercetin dioxygenase-like cupin family protein
MGTRRQFVRQGSFGLFSLFALQESGFSELCRGEFKGIVVNEEEGEAYQLRDGRAVVKIKITGEQGSKSISFLSSSFDPGDEIFIHKHLNEDELIYIQQGSGIFTLDEKKYTVNAGTVALVPRGIWHGLKNTGTEKIEMRFAYTPAGIEGFFREVGTPLGQAHIPKTMEERKAIGKKWGIVYKS